MNAPADILVVDDEPVVGDAVRLVLGDAGWSVAHATSARAALAHPAFAGCRLALCDLMLPGESGLELVRAMRRRRPELPIILITGYATPASAASASEAGATAFLPKPFDETELLTLVRHVLERAAVAREEGRP